MVDSLKMGRLSLAVCLCAAAGLLAELGGCASTPPPPSSQAPLLIAGRTPQAILGKRETARLAGEIPAQYRKKVLAAEAFGRTIHAYDRLAKAAGKLVAPGGQSPFDYPPVGWLTERTPAGLRLSFIVRGPRKLGVAAEVVRSAGGVQVHRLVRPRALTPHEEVLWKARELAYSSKFKPCSKRYNPIVIPARIAGAAFIDVFLLPASADPATVLLGGYHRIAISHDGNAIIEDHAFTRGCITLHRKGKVTAARVTEILSDTPTAPQVYASLRYDLPIEVVTLGNGLSWRVANGYVSLRGDAESTR